MVMAVLRESVDPDVKTIDGQTPLHWTAKHGHSKVLADLLRSGANPAEPTRNGRSALHWAASRGHQSVVEILLSDDRVGCTNRIKRLSVGINDWILTEDLSTNK